MAYIVRHVADGSFLVDANSQHGVPYDSTWKHNHKHAWAFESVELARLVVSREVYVGAGEYVVIPRPQIKARRVAA